jgi:hypothetical protein
MFLPLLAIFRRNIQLFYETTSLTTDPLFFVSLGLIYCITQNNGSVVSEVVS